VHILLTELPPERLGNLYEALEPQAQRALDAAIGRALNSRPQSVVRRPLVLRMKALRAWLLRTRDDDLAGELLRAYFLGARKALVTGFLDATGVKHDEGSVEDEGVPDEAKIPAAVEAALAAHDPGDVLLYLEIAALQWPESQAIKQALETRKPAPR